MKPKMIFKLFIYLVFTVLLLYALMYRVNGDAAHEWIGLALCAVCIIHNVLNWKWYTNIFKDAYNLRRG
ncbi:MAG: hypothetical protein LBD86_07095 [Spirochaetaceae bacterium]|jgi:cytochrome b|nr:hypothetical protein [Spirochaetaceae bacterium]